MTLPEFFMVVFAMSLFCVGLYTTISIMLVTFLDEDPHSITEDAPKVLRIIAKPLFTCVNCMASIWGTVVFWYWTPWEKEYIGAWIIACVACAFLNGLLQVIYTRLQQD